MIDNRDTQLARKERAVEGKPFGPGSATENKAKP